MTRDKPRAAGRRARLIGVFGGPMLAALALGAPGTALSRMPAFPKASLHARRTLVLQDWRLRIERNGFSQDVACRLRSRDGRMLYMSGALGFRFGRHVDVMQAWYRLDRGEPHRWRDTLPELARSGVAIDGRDLDAPTDGIVWLPVAWIEEANRVDIQPRPQDRPRAFHLRGFAGLREIARTMGCAPETRFVR